MNSNAGSILLVEDDSAIATVITAALEDENFEVERCKSVDHRNQLLAHSQFDAMLTNVMLEDGDGLDTLDTARLHAPDMPIIVLSAQNTLDTAVRATDNDAFEYFPKPFDLDELVSAVRQAVGRKKISTQRLEAMAMACLWLVEVRPCRVSIE